MNKKKIILLVLAVLIGGYLCFLMSTQDERLVMPHSEEYTEDEWNVLSAEEQKGIREMRLCRYAEPGHTEGVHGLVVPLGVDCTKYTPKSIGMNVNRIKVK